MDEEEEEEAAQEKAAVSKRRYSEPLPASSSAPSKEETKEERVIRLLRIVEMCTSDESLDKPRALKTLEKIEQIDLTLSEIRSFLSYARIIKRISEKHSDQLIREKAALIMQKWKGVSGNGRNGSSGGLEGSTVTNVSSSNLSSLAVETVARAEEGKEEAGFNVAALPTEVAENPIRLRALRLLYEVIASQSVASKLEQAIFDTFAQKPTYFEAVIRFHTAWKDQTPLEAQQKVLAGLANTRAMMHDTFEYNTVYG